MHIVHAPLVLCAPNVGKDVVKRQDLARVAGKIHQEAELNRRELQPFFLYEDLASIDIDAQVTVIEFVIGAGRASPLAAPQNCLCTRE